MQQNWIGRSEGARVKFPLEEAARPTSKSSRRASTRFTARRSCCSGPSIRWSRQLAEKTQDPAAFRKQAQTFRTQDRAARMSGEIEKQGFDTGFRAINPFTKQPVPIWVANFVLGDYGTGAVMAVPAHDQRDFEFARKFNLPIKDRHRPGRRSGARRRHDARGGRRRTAASSIRASSRTCRRTTRSGG